MFSPCSDYCYARFGKQYTKECDDTCEYANAIKEANESLKNARDIIQKYEEYFISFSESLDKSDKIISEIVKTTEERSRLQTETEKLLDKILKK